MSGVFSTWRRTFNVDEEVQAVRRERRERRRAEWAVERAGLAYEEPAEVRAGDEQPCQLREALEAVHSPQSVGAPLLTPHGADGGGARQVARAINLLQDGREEVRVAQDVPGSGGDGGRRRRRCRGHSRSLHWVKKTRGRLAKFSRQLGWSARRSSLCCVTLFLGRRRNGVSTRQTKLCSQFRCARGARAQPCSRRRTRTQSCAQPRLTPPLPKSSASPAIPRSHTATRTHTCDAPSLLFTRARGLRRPSLNETAHP